MRNPVKVGERVYLRCLEQDDARELARATHLERETAHRGNGRVPVSVIAFEAWPRWWRGVRSVEKRIAGDRDGIGAVYGARLPFCVAAGWFLPVGSRPLETNIRSLRACDLALRAMPPVMEPVFTTRSWSAP